VRNNICGVTGSRSSRKEKNSSEEEQEENKVRTLKISGLLLVGFVKVRKLRNPGTSFRRTHAIQSSRGKELGGPPRKLGGNF
jgi:hypothetical protein